MPQAQHRATSAYKQNDICYDIVYLNPKQIVFTCIRSNGRLFKDINSMLPSKLRGKIIRRFDGKNVFNSPSNRAFSGFLFQLNQVVKGRRLIL
jgi:hypothetical protein